MIRKLTRKEFIEKSIRKHGNTYDYSKVVYNRNRDRVVIICKVHGEFSQIAANHLNGMGCKLCRINKTRLGWEEFITKARKCHGDKYNYSSVIYINNSSKVKIICPIHGAFRQTPRDHLSGHGCNKCGGSYSDITHFINMSRKIHKNKYNYDKVEYTNNKIKVEIVCPEHGSFFQKPNNHILGQGCPKCIGRNKSLQEFIDMANLVHNDRYDYSQAKYVTMKTPILIVCLKHGEFSQTPKSHLRGSGCPMCAGNRISNGSQKWLDSLGVPAENRECFINLPNDKRYIVDGIDFNNKIVYEFNGDFWHGNPKIYSSNDTNPVNKIKFGELYKRTLEKRRDLTNFGYKVISIWESEFKGE